MSRQDALFLLIKSLSPGEKALVRQIEQKEAGYLALFDLIGRQAEFDERKLKKKLQSLGHEINFAYAKNYLSKHILRTLREARNGAGVERTVLEIQILMERKVFSLAGKMLLKARETAWEEERWSHFLELTQIELRLHMQEGGDVDSSIARIQAINAQRSIARAKLNNLGEYEDLYALYRPIVKRKQIARNERDLELVQDFGRHPLLLQDAAADSARALRMQLYCRVLIHLYQGDFVQAHQGIAGVLAHFQRHAFLLDDFPEDYLNDLLRHGGMQLHFGQIEAVQETLQQIRAFQRERNIHGAELFDKYYRLLIGMCIQTKDATRLLSEWAQLREGLDTHRVTLPPASRITLMALMARFQFEQGNLGEARIVLEEILADAETGVREDVVSLARLMLVFIYSEKKDHELAEAASRAARKYLARREQLFAFERRILHFFEHFADVADSAKELGAYQKLKSDLTEIFKDKLEANVLSIFDIMAWLERRIAQLGK